MKSLATFAFFLFFGMLIAQNATDLGAMSEIGPIRTDFEIIRTWKIQASVDPIAIPFSNSFQDYHVGISDPFPAQKIGEQDVFLNTSGITSTNNFLVSIGRNFEGNNLTGGTPSDNNIAVSNGGLIVSVDNYSLAYFKENGDTITKFGLPLSKLYHDSTMNRSPFDPRVIYDSYRDRFILVSLFRSNDYLDSRALISFSKPLTGDTVEWNHYQINCDSIFTLENEGTYYFDYPNITVSKSQFLMTMAVNRRDTAAGLSYGSGNVLFQITKDDGYNEAPNFGTKVWKNVANTENMTAINIVPAMDALQGGDYDTTVYLVSNYNNSSTKFFWFELRGGPNSPSSQLIPHATFTNFFYSYPAYASQFGGNGGDRISILDCDIQYCLYQNKKLHFVLTRSDNGWSELVYANINITNNSFFASTYSGAATSDNYLRPSIASFGKDSTDENFLIGFLRTGPNTFPDLCAINYDIGTGWSANETLVKLGIGILDLRPDVVAPWDTLERLGDYSDIQRRYGDPFKRCWMVGAYASGPLPNYFGIMDGLNAWIAELGDTLPALTIPEAVQNIDFSVYPNPVSSGGDVSIQFSKHFKGSLEITDILGKGKNSFEVNGLRSTFPTWNLGSGMYFVSIHSNGKSYGTKKIIIRN